MGGPLGDFRTARSPCPCPAVEESAGAARASQARVPGREAGEVKVSCGVTPVPGVGRRLPAPNSRSLSGRSGAERGAGSGERRPAAGLGCWEKFAVALTPTFNSESTPSPRQAGESERGAAAREPARRGLVGDLGGLPGRRRGRAGALAGGGGPSASWGFLDGYTAVM